MYNMRNYFWVSTVVAMMLMAVSCNTSEIEEVTVEKGGIVKIPYSLSVSNWRRPTMASRSLCRWKTGRRGPSRSRSERMACGGLMPADRNRTCKSGTYRSCWFLRLGALGAGRGERAGWRGTLRESQQREQGKHGLTRTHTDPHGHWPHDCERAVSCAGLPCPSVSVRVRPCPSVFSPALGTGSAQCALRGPRIRYFFG